MPGTGQPLRSSPHKTWVFVACLGVPLTARANGIDLPVLLGVGLGIILPLLLLNATIEAPILGRILGLNFSDVWYPWFKANAWSLLSGIPALMINSALADWLLPTSLGPRFRVYPFFLPLCLAVYF